MRGPRIDISDIDPSASRRIFLGMIALIAGAAVALWALRRPTPPPPPDVAADPLLVAGREIYLSRCASCHGAEGGGDGPIAKGLAGPSPRDFRREAWKHGDRPEDALAVVAKGVPETTMPGWAGTYSPDELRAVTAYVYYLAGKPTPEAFRAP